MTIIPVTNDNLLFHCIHNGPLELDKVSEEIAPDNPEVHDQFERNRTFLSRLVDLYGACGMLLIDKDTIVGHVRFYPRAVTEMYEFCCQVPEYAITDKMIEAELPVLDKPEDRHLKINCFLIDKAYRGKGLTKQLITAIIDWASEHGWSTVSALATHDNYWLSQQMCIPKLHTYLSLGFEQKETIVLPEAVEHLNNIIEGKRGADLQHEYEQYCADSDPETLSCLFEVERKVNE